MSTSDNLKSAFSGESQANRKYLAFAKKAEAEGLPGVARLFRAIAEAETIHAHTHLRVMGGIKQTSDNLLAAMEGESYEYQQMYPAFAAEAEKESNKAALTSFKYAMEAERIHHALYAAALEAVKAGKDLPQESVHVCPVCGHTVMGGVESNCPICGANAGKYIEVR